MQTSHSHTINTKTKQRKVQAWWDWQSLSKQGKLCSATRGLGRSLLLQSCTGAKPWPPPSPFPNTESQKQVKSEQINCLLPAVVTLPLGDTIWKAQRSFWWLRGRRGAVGAFHSGAERDGGMQGNEPRALCCSSKARTTHSHPVLTRSSGGAFPAVTGAGLHRLSNAS